MSPLPSRSALLPRAPAFEGQPFHSRPPQRNSKTANQQGLEPPVDRPIRRLLVNVFSIYLTARGCQGRKSPHPERLPPRMPDRYLYPDFPGQASSPRQALAKRLFIQNHTGSACQEIKRMGEQIVIGSGAPDPKGGKERKRWVHKLRPRSKHTRRGFKITLPPQNNLPTLSRSTP